MADKNMTPPPINRNGRGPMFRPREKPKNLKGTLLRLWSLTKGQLEKDGLDFASICFDICFCYSILPLSLARQ